MLTGAKWNLLLNNQPVGYMKSPCVYLVGPLENRCQQISTGLGTHTPSHVGYVVRVNGDEVDKKISKGYVTLKRRWKKGDRITLNLNMSVRRVYVNPKIKQDSSCILTLSMMRPSTRPK